MDKQYKAELLKPAKRIFKRRTIKTFYKDDIWSADLIDLQKYSTDNDNVKYLLLIINIYSRHIWIFPLKNKESKNVLNAFKSLDNLPTNLWTDLGSEFISKEFKRWCERNDINLYHTGGESKAVFAERAIRTIRGLISETMIETNSTRYIDNLNEIVEQYNHKIHSSVKETPYDIYYEGKEPMVEYVFSHGLKPKFRVGDFVRISVVKGKFEKGYTPNWSSEVFKIIAVDKSDNPIIYQLEDLKGEPIKGKFYNEELQRTELKDYTV